MALTSAVREAPVVQPGEAEPAHPTARPAASAARQIPTPSAEPQAVSRGPTDEAPKRERSGRRVGARAEVVAERTDARPPAHSVLMGGRTAGARDFRLASVDPQGSQEAWGTLAWLPKDEPT